MHEDIIAKASAREAITYDEAVSIVSSVKGGEMSTEEAHAFSHALFTKESPIESITAITRALRDACDAPIKPATDEDLVEVCGTGGGISEFNSSVASAIVAAAGGAKVAKHVMPALPGHKGDEDLLASLGINIDLTAEQAAEMIDKVGCAFISARLFNPTVDQFITGEDDDARVFFHNVIGPLLNPASPKRCFIGIADKDLQEVVTSVAKEIGYMNGMIVCGVDGVDEISMIGSTHVNELASGRIVNWDTTPDENGIERCSAEETKIGSPKEAMYALKSVLSGKLQGPRREAVVLNGAAALMSGGKAGYFARGIMTVRNMLDDGTVAAKLEEIKKAAASYKK